MRLRTREVDKAAIENQKRETREKEGAREKQRERRVVLGGNEGSGEKNSSGTR